MPEIELDNIHDRIAAAYTAYVTENAKFENGNKAAGTRARKLLAVLAKLGKMRRQEIQDAKNGETSDDTDTPA